MNDLKKILEDKVFEGIVVILDNKLYIKDANKVFLNLLDLKLSDIANKHLTDLIVPDEKSLVFDLTFSQSISNKMTLKFYHNSGAFRFFTFSVMNFDNYKVLIGNTLKKDFLAKKYEYISDRKTSIDNVFENILVDDIRDLLSFKDNTLSLIIDLMPIEVWVKDKLGKYVFVNKTYTEATGITNVKCISKDDFQLFSYDTATSFVESDDLAKNSGKRISFSFENSDINMASYAEVTKIPIYNNNHKYIGMLGFSINTSHSRASELLLEREKSRLMFILDNIDGFVFEINSKSELLFVSRKLKDLLGLNLDNFGLMNKFLKSTKTMEAKEKLKLALNGEKINIDTDIMGNIINFILNPVINNDGTYNIVGIGNLVSKGGETDGK